MHSPTLRAFLLLTLLPTAGCGDEPASPQRNQSRSARYAPSSGEDAAPSRDVSQRPEGSRAADVQTGPPTATPSTETKTELGPPTTDDADVLEAAVYRNQPWSLPGTRAQSLRCQAAIGAAAERFAPTWYAYDDRANPGTPIRGCETGLSESILEALPRGEGRTELCAIGWHAVLRSGSAYPFVGMGVRTPGGLAGVKTMVVETRSTGRPIRLAAQLHMQEQEALPCGDSGGGPHVQPLTCDGSGEWVAQRLPIRRFVPSWGTPPKLNLDQVSALHFQSGPGQGGSFQCDIRIAAVE